MCAPLVSMKACIGVINVVNTRNGRDFTQGDLSLLSSVANLAALCIEKQRANLERIRRERLNQQYEDALKIERLMIRDPVEGEEESVQPVLIKTQAGASVEEDHADRMQALYDRLKDDYKDLQRLQDLRRNLTDMIVHDLRSPLGSASGFLELLQGREGTRLSKSGQSWLEKAMRSTRSIIEMVNSMLDISRLEEGKLKVEIWPQDLTEIVKEAINLLEGSFPTELINRSFPTVARTVYCDKSLIVRVVTNLLGNAIKFCPRGQPIDVSIEFSGEEVTVSVVDHGIGIPEKYHEKIFEKFGQVEARKDRSVPSTGLGLTFCKLVVDSHRGTIGVESAPNEGSRFWFSLPLDPQGRESATP